MNELIEKYFENNLTKKEEASFKKLLVEDAEFKSEFEFQTELQNAIKVSERQNIKKQIQQFDNLENKPIFHLRSFLKYAAILLILISAGIYFFTNQNSSEQLYASYYEAYPNTEISVTRSDTNAQSAFEDAFVAYDLNDFNKANQLFDKVLHTKDADYIKFYKAICLMELNQHKEAINWFESISSTSNYQDKAMWFKSLCLLKLSNPTGAKEVLEQLVTKQSFKFIEAQELLSKL